MQENNIDSRYNNRMKQLMAGSKETFNQFDTPGWSSLVKSQISQRKKTLTKQQEILNKIKQTPLNNLQSPSEQLVDHTKRRNKQREDQIISVNAKSTFTQQSKGEIHQKQRLINKSTSSIQTNNKSKAKRWNQLTIHEHLYLDSKHLENKRMIQKIIDQQMQKQYILKFKPSINSKSRQLAELKFSRNQEQSLDIQFQNLNIEKSNVTKKTEATNEGNQKQSKQVIRYKILNRTFYYISQQSTILSKQQLHSVVENLPLPAIKTLQPILSKVYKGKTYSWVQFLQLFNSKQVTNKESFIIIMQKWFKKMDKNKSNNTSQNIDTC